jgi:murein hydrolase activator
VRVVIACALLCASLWAVAAPQDDLQELRERMEALKRELAQSEQNKTEAADALEASERSISDTNRKLRELSGKLREARGQLDDLRGRTDRAQNAVRREQALLEQAVYQRYLNRGDSSLPLLLSGKEPADIVRAMSYYGYIAKERNAAIDKLNSHLSELDSLKTSTQRKANELTDLETQERHHHDALKAERERREKVLANVAGDIERQQREMSHLKRNEERLTRLIEQIARMLARKEAQRKEAARKAVARKEALRREAARKAAREKQAARAGEAPREPPPPRAEEPDEEEPPKYEGIGFGKLKGRLRSPAQGELLGRFHGPRGGGVSGNGIFIGSQAGQDVRAVAQGRVVFADWLRGFGNLIILDHGGGYLSVYGNNESLLKQVGEDIRAGESIAVTGNSGGNAQTGLYFELRFKGKPIDPAEWLGRRG